DPAKTAPLQALRRTRHDTTLPGRRDNEPRATVPGTQNDDVRMLAQEGDVVTESGSCLRRGSRFCRRGRNVVTHDAPRERYEGCVEQPAESHDSTPRLRTSCI